MQVVRLKREEAVSAIARLTLAQYDRMIERGVFEQDEHRRLEFIRGEIREMNPIGSLHDEVVTRLAEWSYENVSRKRARIRVQGSIGLSDVESAPQPDIVWVASRDYSARRPTAHDVLLIIEVAETSLAYDGGEKADLYAAAGIADYWVVNLPDRSVEVRREPHASRYRSLQTFTGQAEVRPLGAPDVVLRPATLFPS